MYAVVSTGGKQYRVEAGSELIVERLSGDPGASVTFDRVLLVGDGESVTIGTPTVDGARVSATVIGEARGPKLIVFKFKQKVKYRRTTGHRQHLTRVRIDEISADGKRATAEDARAAEPTPEAKKASSAPKTKKAAHYAADAEATPPRTRRTSTTKPKADAGGTKRAPRRRSTSKKAESAEE